jgi:hypothetical protein
MLESTDPFAPPSRPIRWWEGKSGRRYYVAVYGIGELFDFGSIVYLVTQARLDGFYDPLYIGQTGDGEERLGRHPKFARALALGATHVHIHWVDGKADRIAVETDLRHQHPTALNEQSIPERANVLASPLAALGAVPGFGPLLGIAPSGLSAPLPARVLGGTPGMTPLKLEGLGGLAEPPPPPTVALGPPSGTSTPNDLLGLGSPLDWLLRSGK